MGRASAVLRGYALPYAGHVRHRPPVTGNHHCWRRLLPRGAVIVHQQIEQPLLQDRCCQLCHQTLTGLIASLPANGGLDHQRFHYPVIGRDRYSTAAFRLAEVALAKGVLRVPDFLGSDTTEVPLCLIEWLVVPLR